MRAVAGSAWLWLAQVVRSNDDVQSEREQGTQGIYTLEVDLIIINQL